MAIEITVKGTTLQEALDALDAITARLVAGSMSSTIMRDDEKATLTPETDAEFIEERVPRDAINTFGDGAQDVIVKFSPDANNTGASLDPDELSKRLEDAPLDDAYSVLTIDPNEVGVLPDIDLGDITISPEAQARLDAEKNNPPPPPPPADVELDSEGLPWDGRIHSAQKTKKKTGEWKVTRGKDPALVASVKAELLSAQQAVAPTSTTGTGATDLVGTSTTAPPAPPAPPAGEIAPENFPALVNWIMANGITDSAIDAVLAEFKIVGGLPMLSTRPDLIESAWAKLCLTLS